jgi:hypothetical protein
LTSHVCNKHIAISGSVDLQEYCRNWRTNQRFYGSNCMELKKADGKTERKNFANYFRLFFPQNLQLFYFHPRKFGFLRNIYLKFVKIRCV